MDKILDGDEALPNTAGAEVRCRAVFPGQGNEMWQVVALSLAINQTRANDDPSNAGRFEHRHFSFCTRRHRRAESLDERLRYSGLGRCEDRSGQWDGMILVEFCRTCLSLGEDPENRRSAGEDKWLSGVFQRGGHRCEIITIFGQTVRRPADLADATPAEYCIHIT